MPIAGATPQDALRKFADHLNSLLSRTVTRARLVQFTTPGGMQLAFRATEARLTTKFGPVGLYIGQICDAEAVAKNTYQLQTIAYTYHSHRSERTNRSFAGNTCASPTTEARWCRHHLQGPVRIDFGTEEVTMNDLHLPTGWVTIEELLRFCIVDLGAEPLTERWHEVLVDSYERFKLEFAPVGSV